MKHLIMVTAGHVDHGKTSLLDSIRNTDVVSGVPVMLGAKGAEKIIDVTLDEKEKAMFAQSCKSVQDFIDTLNKNKFFEGE